MTRIPLLKDNHNHLFTYSVLSNSTSLFFVKDKNKALKIFCKLQPDKMNIVTGWFDSYYNFTQEELNSLPPIIICNNSLHKYLFNNKAKSIISVDFPEWTENNEDQNWIERKLRSILSYLSDYGAFDKSLLETTLIQNMHKGVCFASDMYVTSKNVFEFLSQTDFRNYTEIWTNADIYPAIPKKYKDLCEGVKLFTDGALGASSASISHYKSLKKGLLIYTDKEFREKIEEFLSFRTNIAIHCIGDVAIGQVINTLKATNKKKPDIKIRLEHVQFINKKQAFLAKDLGLILSMQPNFNMDSVIYSDRLTQQYCEANNPFRMLIDDVGFVPGKDLIFGSDGMPTGIAGALQNSLFPPVPGQKISLDEFVSAYCTNDFEKGYINVHIDNLKKKVITEVII